MKNWIKNFDQIATTDLRKDLLAIAAAGLDAIDTETVITKNVKIENNILTVKDQTFDLGKFKSIKVLGFGKVSCEAALILEKIFGSQIKAGITIGLEKTACTVIQTYAGSHPQPSDINVNVSEQMIKMAEGSTENDLVIVIVSGGGSSLLCYPLSECEQGKTLYQSFLKTGGNIEELNVVRKHLSQVKGGGLAKALYPATVVSLIFSDVPDKDFESVASGPTYFDNTTKEDAKKIIDDYKLGTFELVETPKEQKYFEKVHNIPLVWNHEAVLKMKERAENLGYTTKEIPEWIKSQGQEAIEDYFQKIGPKTAIVGGGETTIKVTRSDGTGGRNLFLSMLALRKIQAGQAFLSVASDGLDNSDALGAIADEQTLAKTKAANINLEGHIERFDAYNFFQKTDNLIMSGPTNANVSDLMILIQK